MKIVLLISALAITTSVILKTNYHDLPAKDAEKLEELLNTDDLTNLNDVSLDIMKEFASKAILNEENIFYDDNNNIKSKYFHNIYNRLPTFVSKKERHTGYHYSGEKEGQQTKRNSLLAYSIYRIDRSPDNINQLFKYCEPRLQKLLPKSKYHSLGVSKSINSLINTYNFITKTSKYKENLEAVYSTVDTLTGGTFSFELGEERYVKFEDGALSQTLWSSYEIYDKYLKMSKYSNKNEDTYETSWAFSFWVRRHKEGNMTAVYDIINRIKVVYE